MEIFRVVSTHLFMIEALDSVAKELAWKFHEYRPADATVNVTDVDEGPVQGFKLEITTGELSFRKYESAKTKLREILVVILEQLIRQHAFPKAVSTGHLIGERLNDYLMVNRVLNMDGFCTFVLKECRQEQRDVMACEDYVYYVWDDFMRVTMARVFQVPKKLLGERKDDD